MKDELYDCVSCGACCATELDDGQVADLSEEDVKRLGPRRLKLYGTMSGGRYGDEPHWATQSVENKQGLIVCRALRGSVGGKCSCRIYVDRPTVCQQFKPGSAACHDARRQVGLPVEKKRPARGTRLPSVAR